MQDGGRHVPKDAAVVGCDDREVASPVRPALTTVALLCIEMGRAASWLLLGPLDGQDRPAAAEQVRRRLIARESCGARAVRPGDKEF